MILPGAHRTGEKTRHAAYAHSLRPHSPTHGGDTCVQLHHLFIRTQNRLTPPVSRGTGRLHHGLHVYRSSEWRRCCACALAARMWHAECATYDAEVASLHSCRIVNTTLQSKLEQITQCFFYLLLVNINKLGLIHTTEAQTNRGFYLYSIPHSVEHNCTRAIQTCTRYNEEVSQQQSHPKQQARVCTRSTRPNDNTSRRPGLHIAAVFTYVTPGRVTSALYT